MFAGAPRPSDAGARARVARGAGGARIEPEVYTFDPEPLLAVLRSVPDEVASVMLVGHNPAFHDLAVMLARTGDDLPDLVAKYPTGALAEFEPDASSWSELAEGGAVLTRFVDAANLGALAALHVQANDRAAGERPHLHQIADLVRDPRPNPSSDRAWVALARSSVDRCVHDRRSH